LYWRTAQHCWYSKRHGPRVKAKPSIEPNGSIEPKKIAKIAPAALAAQAHEPTVAYPTLMAGGGTVNAMLQPEAMTHWPFIMDVDEPPPQFIPWQERITPLER
jgi:hypothetical protein